MKIDGVSYNVWVALRKESVDRNHKLNINRPTITVALRKESVDRNTQRRDFKRLGLLVALRKESVDRNANFDGFYWWVEGSLSARRAWIEIILFVNLRVLDGVALRKESVDRNSIVLASFRACICRSPQGERG